MSKFNNRALHLLWLEKTSNNLLNIFNDTEKQEQDCYLD